LKITEPLKKSTMDRFSLYSLSQRRKLGNSMPVFNPGALKERLNEQLLFSRIKVENNLKLKGISTTQTSTISIKKSATLSSYKAKR
jgi:hypothetical protein